MVIHLLNPAANTAGLEAIQVCVFAEPYKTPKRVDDRKRMQLLQEMGREGKLFNAVQPASPGSKLLRLSTALLQVLRVFLSYVTSARKLPIPGMLPLRLAMI